MASGLESASPQGKDSLLPQRVAKQSFQNIPCQGATISGLFALTKRSEEHRCWRVYHNLWGELLNMGLF